MTTIATSNNDPQLAKNWACTWNSPSQITLNRPWDGPTETGAYAYSYVLAGFGQQPFMLGIHITQMKFASQIGDPRSPQAMPRLRRGRSLDSQTGYDPVTQGMYYGRVMQACEPATFRPPIPRSSRGRRGAIWDWILQRSCGASAYGRSLAGAARLL